VPNPNIRKHAAEGGFAKAAAQAAAQRALLRAALPVDGLPPLDSIENAQARLEIVNRLTVQGDLPGGAGSAAVRAVEVWLKAESARIDRIRMHELEATCAALKAELRELRRGSGRAPRHAEEVGL
jgi:hypothetical protein